MLARYPMNLRSPPPERNLSACSTSSRIPDPATGRAEPLQSAESKQEAPTGRPGPIDVRGSRACSWDRYSGNTAHAAFREPDGARRALSTLAIRVDLVMGVCVP
jgi:hypothetical protein